MYGAGSLKEETRKEAEIMRPAGRGADETETMAAKTIGAVRNAVRKKGAPEVRGGRWTMIGSMIGK